LSWSYRGINRSFTFPCTSFVIIACNNEIYFSAHIHISINARVCVCVCMHDCVCAQICIHTYQLWLRYRDMSKMFQDCHLPEYLHSSNVAWRKNAGFSKATIPWAVTSISNKTTLSHYSQQDGYICPWKPLLFCIITSILL